MELVGLDHYAINVFDLQRAAHWYRRAFGFTVLHKWPDVWMVGRGNIKVGLFLKTGAVPPPDLETLFVIKHVAFLVDGDKFTAAQDKLRREEIPFDPPEDTGIAYSVFVKDPDGNSLEITTYHPAKAVSSA